MGQLTHFELTTFQAEVFPKGHKIAFSKAAKRFDQEKRAGTRAVFTLTLWPQVFARWKI
jgi:hypothetical protein